MGICHSGKTLKQVVDERENLFKETGHAFGLKKLELVDKDPAKFMRFQMRLVAACIGARETAKLISANPMSMVQGELLFMLAGPEGDVVSASYGLAGHVQCFPFMVRAMANLGYEDDPGISPGDVFFNNDAMYGAPHNADCYSFVPIFYKGELIGWTVGLNHIVDVGGLQPGGLGTVSTSVFTDGFTVPISKVGANFKTHKWWELQWTRRTRTATFNILDDKMRTAGCVTLQDRILQVVEEFGVDYFRQGLKEIIERERRGLVERIKLLAVPGIYQYLHIDLVSYKGVVGKLFAESDRDWLLHLPGEMHILPDGSLYLDLEGLASEGDFHINAYEPALRAMTTLGAWPMYAYTQTINTALYYATKWNLPPGCLFNPQNPFAATVMGLVAIGKYTWLFQNPLTMAFFARGYLEECLSQDPEGVGYGLAGVMEDGFRWAGGDMTLITAWAGGATPFKDGEPAMVCTPNPAPDMGEAELVEFLQPTNLTIGRKMLTDYCGAGKFRGGQGNGVTHMIVKPGKSLVAAVMGSCTSFGRMAMGMSGAYPSPGDVAYFAHDTNLRELIEQGKPYPTDFIEIGQWLRDGRLKAGSVEIFKDSTPTIPLKDGDLMSCASGARCGWGDVIERKYGAVERDVHYGWITPGAAKAIYGVATDSDGKVKVAESDALRAGMRKARIEKSMDAKDWWYQEREVVLNKAFSPRVRGMYADCLKWPKFRKQFIKIWQLPEDYAL
jgi:acetone carboxylase, alpha subunit